MEGAAAVASGVQELLPVLRDRAQETEDRRQLSAETVKSLAATGFFRLLQPARFGGWRRLGASDSSPGGWWLGNLLRLGDSSFPLILT